MARIEFTQNLARHLDCTAMEVGGETLGAVLEDSCSRNPALRSYLLDDQGRLRKHVTVFIDGNQVSDKSGLSDQVFPDSSIYVMQALSGG